MESHTFGFQKIKTTQQFRPFGHSSFNLQRTRLQIITQLFVEILLIILNLLKLNSSFGQIANSERCPTRIRIVPATNRPDRRTAVRPASIRFPIPFIFLTGRYMLCFGPAFLFFDKTGSLGPRASRSAFQRSLRRSS
jgi:hypothetical protein